MREWNKAKTGRASGKVYHGLSGSDEVMWKQAWFWLTKTECRRHPIRWGGGAWVEASTGGLGKEAMVSQIKDKKAKPKVWASMKRAEGAVYRQMGSASMVRMVRGLGPGLWGSSGELRCRWIHGDSGAAAGSSWHGGAATKRRGAHVLESDVVAMCPVGQGGRQSRVA